VVATNAQICTTGAQCGSGTCTGGQCVCDKPTGTQCNPGFVCSATPGICVGAGAWPTATVGQTGASNLCAVDFGAAAGGKAYDLSGNLQEWTSTPVSVDSGTTATIGTPSGGQVAINGMANVLASYLGAQLIVSGATNAANNGTFDIVAVNSTTSVTIANSLAVAQASPATVNWSVIYNKLRGGNYATNSPGGEVCEFDFDIEKAAFENNDVGFRCCADHAP
jgi:formylglycine-generating enzyme required for sulfatase activity